MSTLLIVDGTSGNPVYALVHLVEIWDLEVSNRLRRTQGYRRVLATQLRDRPRFAKFLTDQKLIAWSTVEFLRMAKDMAAQEKEFIIP